MLQRKEPKQVSESLDPNPPCRRVKRNIYKHPSAHVYIDFVVLLFSCPTSCVHFSCITHLAISCLPIKTPFATVCMSVACFCFHFALLHKSRPDKSVIYHPIPPGHFLYHLHQEAANTYSQTTPRALDHLAGKIKRNQPKPTTNKSTAHQEAQHKTQPSTAQFDNKTLIGSLSPSTNKDNCCVALFDARLPVRVTPFCPHPPPFDIDTSPSLCLYTEQALPSSYRQHLVFTLL